MPSSNRVSLIATRCQLGGTLVLSASLVVQPPAVVDWDPSNHLCISLFMLTSICYLVDFTIISITYIYTFIYTWHINIDIHVGSMLTQLSFSSSTPGPLRKCTRGFRPGEGPGELLNRVYHYTYNYVYIYLYVCMYIIFLKWLCANFWILENIYLDKCVCIFFLQWF